MTKAKMIETLKLREAEQWTKVENQKAYLQAIHGEESTEKDWSEWGIRMLSNYTTDWHHTFEICKLLNVEPYSWSERQDLLTQEKIKA
jgi:hypothetical protein